MAYRFVWFLASTKTRIGRSTSAVGFLAPPLAKLCLAWPLAISALQSRAAASRNSMGALVDEPIVNKHIDEINYHPAQCSRREQASENMRLPI
jgi:hypothetical protein